MGYRHRSRPLHLVQQISEHLCCFYEVINEVIDDEIDDEFDDEFDDEIDLIP